MTERSLRLRHSRRAKRTLSRDECSLIEDGLVSDALSQTLQGAHDEGNTRVISQTALDHFRTALSTQKADPYSVLLRRNKLPMGLLEDESKSAGKVSAAPSF